MKRHYLISMIISFFSVLVSGQEGWMAQTSPFSSLLTAIFAIDSSNVWAVGQNGLIVHTTNGGATWDSIPNGTESDLNAVEFINAEIGFVGGEKDKSSFPGGTYLIQRTMDGGATWKFQHLASSSDVSVNDIDFIEGPPGEPMRGFSTAGLGHAWRTDDLGDTWVKLSGGCGEGNFNSCFLVDSVTGWFVGTPASNNEYTIMVTADGGNTFEQQTNPVGIKLNDICFGTDLQGIAVGNAGTILYTGDGGKSWEQSVLSELQGITLFSVFLTESGKAWAVGNNGKIAYSADWGHAWELQESGVSAPLWEVHFIDENVGWIVGGLASSIILHTLNGGMTTTGISDFRDDHARPYELEQNYPNPFSSSTKIGYELARSGEISLTVHDLSGREIQTLIKGFQSAGRHALDWDASHLGNGLYFIRLAVDNGPGVIQKMVLTR